MCPIGEEINKTAELSKKGTMRYCRKCIMPDTRTVTNFTPRDCKETMSACGIPVRL